MRFLLDTNIVSDLVRHPQGKVFQHIRKVGEARVSTSIIVRRRIALQSLQEGSSTLTCATSGLRCGTPLGPHICIEEKQWDVHGAAADDPQTVAGEAERGESPTAAAHAPTHT